MSFVFGDVKFENRELRDLLVAWLALGVAFAIFFGGGGTGILSGGDPLGLLVVSLLTAGVGFLLHEVAHKVVAIKFGQIAFFRADYGMLFLAIVTALAGFLFAAPGAVHHRGRLTPRENGLISLAGPATNVALGLLFLPLVFLPGGLASDVGIYGTLVNFFLAAFNMLPFGPLDGKTVRKWSNGVFVAAFATSVLLALGAFLFIF